MASLDDSKLILNDLWPGTPSDILAFPPDLLELSDTAVYPVGTKVRRYDPDNKGWSTFIYLKYMKGADHDIDLAVKDIVGIWDDGSAWYEVLNDGGEMLVNGPLAVALASLDYGELFTAAGKTHKYMWFWGGGVCPTGIVKDASGTKVLDGNFTVNAATQGVGLKALDVAGAPAQLDLKVATDLTPAAGLALATAS